MNTRIKEARKSAKMTQADLANELKLSKNYIYLMESGREKPSKRTISDIARILNVNETWLLNGTGEMHSPITREQALASMIAEAHLNPQSEKAKLIMSFANLDEQDFKDLKRIFEKIRKGMEE